MRRIGTAALVLIALLLNPAAAFSQPSPSPVSPDQPLVPLLEGDDLLLLLIVVVALAMVLLALIVFTVGRSAKMNAGDREAYLPLVQGMVLVTVVVAVILLGISGKLTAEGLASILAAIVGFAVGRATSAPPADKAAAEKAAAERAAQERARAGE